MVSLILCLPTDFMAPADLWQRNVANQFHPDDDSANGLLEYAVGPVGVEHSMSKFYHLSPTAVISKSPSS